MAESRILSPSALLRLLNSSPLGAVVSERALRKHRQQAGYRIGDGKGVNFFRYLGWLHDGRHRPAPAQLGGDELRAHQAGVMRDRRKEGRDIGPVPPVKDPARRERCRFSFRNFITTYYPKVYFKPFSKDHETLIERLQYAIFHGGKFAEGHFRSFGKSVITRHCAEWAVFYGHSQYMPLFAATKDLAKKIIKNIKTELETNRLLLEDFPEVCYPIRELEGLSNRCAGQICGRKPTLIIYSTNKICLPWLPPAPSAGACFEVFGMKTAVLGLQHIRPDGAVIRPDLAIIDDPQTPSSAKSPSECKNREELILGGILGLEGLEKPLSVFMTCTPFEKDDLADRFLDTSIYPDWQGERVPMVTKWPDEHENMWLKTYADLRRQVFFNDKSTRARAEKEADEFYLANKEQMDRGAEVSWEQGYIEGQAHSAIQFAYDRLIDRGAKIFASQYQCQPIDELSVSSEPPLEPRDVLKKLNQRERRIIPAGMTALTSFIDLGSRKNIYWLTCAWGASFTGAIIDAGQAEMKQSRHGIEAALADTLMWVLDEVLGRSYPVENGGERKPGVVLVDSGWQARTVYQVCRVKMREHVYPSKGWGDEFELRAPKRVPTVDRGDHWFHSLNPDRDAILLNYNTDTWKSFAAERIRTPIGGNGSMSLWGSKPEEHRLLSEQLTSEFAFVKEKKNGDIFLKWRQKVGRVNHLWDCLVGCCVGASRLGVALAPSMPKASPSGGLKTSPGEPKVSSSDGTKTSSPSGARRSHPESRKIRSRY